MERHRHVQMTSNGSLGSGYVVVDSLFIVHLVVLLEFCVFSLFGCAVFGVVSGFAVNSCCINCLLMAKSAMLTFR